MNRSNLAYLVAVALTSVACAPRVSKHAPGMHPSLAPVYAPKGASTAKTTSAERAKPVVTPVEPARTAHVAPVEHREATPVMVSAVESRPARERRTVAVSQEELAATPKPVAKTNFYAFSDAEVSGLRKRSPDFRKLHDNLKTCQAKTEAAIQKREQVREDIIRLQNEENRTAKMEKQLIALRLEERKLKASRGEGEDCTKIEDRLTELLRSAYMSNETAGARN
ncbi:hypothetical protein L6R52_07585 [Myxococcota bacterium]|nr:hypothetical protein [Myxococcota bacterium]